MKCTWYVTDCTDPYENLAREELLFSQIQPGEILLYLWQNDNTVVIGRNQNAWRECRLETFSAQNGRLARRLSGGGAVYHDMGNQNFTFIAPHDLYDVECQTEVIRLAVNAFGINAERSGRNDIQADSKKFSGNAFHRGKDAAFHHGTILISSDMGRLSKFLAPSPEKLEAKGVKSVRARVINLAELNPDITPKGIRAAILDAFDKVYGVAPQPLNPSRIDPEKLKQLTARYADDDWRLGRMSEFDYSFRRRFSFGELEFHFSVQNGNITEARVYSDAMDALWVKELENSLASTPFNTAALAAAVPNNSQSEDDAAEVADFFREMTL